MTNQKKNKDSDIEIKDEVIHTIETSEPKPEEIQEEVKNKDEIRRSGTIITVATVLIVLLFLSIFASNYARNNSSPKTLDDLHKLNLEGKETDENYMYNGYSFVRLDNMWFFQIQKNDELYDIPLRFSPKEVENVSIDINPSMIDSQNFPQIYMTIDPYTTDATYQALGASELSLNLVQGLNVFPVAACVKQDNDVCKNRTIVDCSYNHAPIIYLKESDQTRVYQNNTCYVIEGKGFELLRAVDRFIYNIYTIMP